MPPPKKLSTGFGRALEEWPPIPPPAHYRVAAIGAYLRATRNIRRPPDTLAWVLAVVCELELKGYYWPARRRLANALSDWKGETVFQPNDRRTRYVDSIDSALTTAIAEDDIREERRVTEGSHSMRPSVHRHRYMRPCQQLMDAYQGAERGMGLATLTQPRMAAATRP